MTAHLLKLGNPHRIGGREGVAKVRQPPWGREELRLPPGADAGRDLRRSKGLKVEGRAKGSGPPLKPFEP